MNKSLLAIALLTASAASYADNCRYSKDYDFSVEASSLSIVGLNVGAGSLTVNGDAAREEVRVVATACANSRNRLDELDLTHTVRGSDLLIRTERHRNNSLFSWLSFTSTYSYINVEVMMPQNLSLDVDDGSGRVEISNVASLSLDDGSGPISIVDIQGNVDIDDGSGSISISGVSGTVSVEDGSGPITIQDSNEVAILDDGSGDIFIENIQSNVRVLNDGSGGIGISDVQGDVEIGDSGSGSVNVQRIAGDYRNRDS